MRLEQLKENQKNTLIYLGMNPQEAEKMAELTKLVAENCIGCTRKGRVDCSNNSFILYRLDRFNREKARELLTEWTAFYTCPVWMYRERNDIIKSYSY